MVAGIVTLRILGAPGVQEQLADTARTVTAALRSEAERAGVTTQIAAIGSMWGFFFAPAPVTNYAAAKATADTALYARFFHACLEEGVYLAPSQFEAAFVSMAHDAEVVEETCHAFARAFSRAGTEGRTGAH
jgi:glutamate-1-semialdehyde 2,1-aminomutase